MMMNHTGTLWSCAKLALPGTQLLRSNTSSTTWMLEAPDSSYSGELPETTVKRRRLVRARISCTRLDQQRGLHSPIVVGVVVAEKVFSCLLSQLFSSIVVHSILMREFCAPC